MIILDHGTECEAQIHRSGTLHAYGLWKAQQDRGVSMLYSISTDPDVLKNLLGTRYDRIITMLGGTSDALPQLPSAPLATTTKPPAKKRRIRNVDATN